MQRTRQAKLIGSAVGFFVFFILIPPFAFLGDRPSQVRGDAEEGFFAAAGQWVSAVFYVTMSLGAMVIYGVWGFALLPLTVLIVARRISAREGFPYHRKDLQSDIADLLGQPKIRSIVLYGTAAALVLDLATAFRLPTSFLSALASAAVWATWMFLAIKAAKVNVDAEVEEQMTRAKHVGMLSKVFSVPVAEWENCQIIDEGLKLTVTPPPMGAVLHYAQADSIFAQVAPQWEMDSGSNHDSLVLNEVSEETKQRRLEEAQSGGLIAGKLSDGYTPSSAVPAFAGVSISADDLY